MQVQTLFWKGSLSEPSGPPPGSITQAWSPLLVNRRAFEAYTGLHLSADQRERKQRLRTSLEDLNNDPKVPRQIRRRFYQWLRGLEDDHPPEVKWIKLRMKNERRILPEELLNPTRKLLASCLLKTFARSKS